MTRRHVIELAHGPHDGERREDNPDNPLLAVICCFTHRYEWDGQPAVLHPDDTAVRRFTYESGSRLTKGQDQ